MKKLFGIMQAAGVLLAIAAVGIMDAGSVSIFRAGVLLACACVLFAAGFLPAAREGVQG